MGRMKFLQWAAAQGWKHGQRYLQKAYNHFYDKGKLPDPKAILQKAKNLYDDVIKKTSTKQVRQKIKEDNTLDFSVPFRNKESIKIIEQFKKNTSPKQWEKIIENLEGIKIPKSPFQGFKPKIVPKKPNPLADVLNARKYTKVPTPPGLKKSNVIPFPKKPPNLKAEGGIAGMLGERTGNGLNYLLGEDDQNSRMPYAEGSSWEQFQKEKLMQTWQEYQQYLKNREKEEREKPYIEERLGIGSGPVLEAAEGGRIGLKDGSWKPPSPGENILESTWKNMGPWEKFMWGLSLGGFEKGGRVGLAAGMTPSESWMRDYFYSGKGGHDDSGMTFEFFQKNIGPDLWYKHIGKAQGGRIGFKEGEGIMSRVGNMVDARNVPYYGGKALQGLVNSAETLSKLPLAAGELGSKLIQQKPNKEMFMEALENITPGSWSENTGLTSLVEGMEEKRPDDAKTVGGILGLGTEIAVPTGGAFKAGQILLSKASKAMGKVKDGKTLEKLVDQKLTDSGQSRRDFMSLVGASGLGIALKSIGLGGLFKAATKVKPSDDVVIRLRTFIDDSDVDTEWGPVAQGQWAGAFDIESLSKAAAKTMEKLMFPGTKGTPRDRIGWSTHRSGHNKGIYEDIPLDEGSYIADTLKKAGHKVKFEHLPEMGGWSVDDILNKFKNDPIYKGTKEGAEKYKKFKEKTDKWSTRKKQEYHTDITDDYGQHHNPDVEDFFDTFYGVEKAEGGRIGLGTGGPPISGQELKQMKKEVSGSGIMDFLKITGSGGMGSNEDIYDQGQQIPGLDQKQYNYGFDVNANVPFNLPGGGMLEIEGGTGFGRGRTETTYKGESVPGMSGMGESKLGDQWNIGAKITYPFADGGLTKTVPPKKGPMPQGLPSALYNGIMRPRSY